jgi:hypothetical protein
MHAKTAKTHTQTSFVAIATLALMITIPSSPLWAAPSTNLGTMTEDRVDAVALKWFAEMRTGQIDRTLLNPKYSQQLTAATVESMSEYMKEHDFGASPRWAEVFREQSIGEQTFYAVKLVFPRGDATSLLFGFDRAGKITGVSVLSMAGD